MNGCVWCVGSENGCVWCVGSEIERSETKLKTQHSSSKDKHHFHINYYDHAEVHEQLSSTLGFLFLFLFSKNILKIKFIILL
jgi:hypothetical protein